MPKTLDERALAVACPWCKALAGAPCVNALTGQPLLSGRSHGTRFAAAAFIDELLGKTDEAPPTAP